MRLSGISQLFGIRIAEEDFESGKYIYSYRILNYNCVYINFQFINKIFVHKEILIGASGSRWWNKMYDGGDDGCSSPPAKAPKLQLAVEQPSRGGCYKPSKTW